MEKEMADVTYTTLKPATAEGLGAGTKSLFSRIFEKLAKAREKEARRLVSQYLATLDDKTLKSLQFDRKDWDIPAN
jgi:hypothetical protein